MDLRIALAGNPNCGKTTLFNALTGSNQFVGKTVEKKEGLLKNHEGVTITDLPGIYSLSPYTPEEVVAREYLVGERPDAIINIVDGTNLERNLYLTTQLVELGIPVVLAVNMMDLVAKNGDEINLEKLSKAMGCTAVPMTAVKDEGVMEAAQTAINAAFKEKSAPGHNFSGEVEHALAHIEEAVVHDMPLEQQRWYAVKIFERDQKVRESLNIDPDVLEHIEEDIRLVEKVMDDDAEAIIINERYAYISRTTAGAYTKNDIGRMSASDKIDRIVTNRWLALPIFAAIMFIVYFVSITLVGGWASEWANEGLFGEGWHLLGSGAAEYEAAALEYAEEEVWTDDVVEKISKAEAEGINGANDIVKAYRERDFEAFTEEYASYGAALTAAGYDISATVDRALMQAPRASDYGVWVPGLPVVIDNLLDKADCADWLRDLILEGILAGVGAVLGFAPQMFILFAFLSFLEACGYMSRIAFVMDKIFRRFGLSGKSFIPLLIGSGCGTTGIMNTRTIESERDRRMTIITTTFIPCGAKLPVIALVSAALFDGSALVATSAYILGIMAVIISGTILKKTKRFSGNPSPFVMELPPYHMPAASNILRAMWDRGWSFIKNAGTVILLASVCVWAGAGFGFVDGAFTFSSSMPLENSIVGKIGGAIAWIFTPLGFGNIKAAVATVMGLLAKEEIVGVFGVLDFTGFTPLSGYSFLIFNLLCAPCLAAMNAIRQEMKSGRWTAFAIGYQCAFAYCVSLMIYQYGLLASGSVSFPGLGGAVLATAAIIYMLFRKTSVGDLPGKGI